MDMPSEPAAGRTPAAPSDIPEGRQFAGWRHAPLSAAQFDALGGGDRLSGAQLAYLAGFNLLAPSSHNSVPQRLRLRDGVMELHVDRAFVLPHSDPTGRQAGVGLGCALANTLVAARCHGWWGDVTVDPEADKGVRPAVAGEPRHAPVATVRFRRAPEDALPDSFLTAMLRRKVVRAEFDPTVELKGALGADLERTVAAHAGLRLHLMRGPSDLLFMGKAQEQADVTKFNNGAFARELGDWLLENDDAGSVGVRGHEFGLGDAAARHVHRGLRLEERLLPDEIAGMARAGNAAMRSSSAVGVITVESDVAAQQIAAGMAYEEVALLLVLADLHTSMHAGVAEVEAVSLAVRGRLRTAARPTVIFRIGRPLRPADLLRPRSARPALADLLLPDPA